MSIPKTGISGFDSYVEAVHSGEELVCGWVKKAVARHIRDMERSAADDPDFPYYFEPKAAIHFFDFCYELRHYKGEFAGQRIILKPWQMFVYGSIFGWLHKETGYRRFREGTIIIPKKNGKSIIAAAVALYLISWEDEPGAEVYNLATSLTHAMKLSYKDARQFVEEQEFLSYMNSNKSMGNMRISNPQTYGFFEPLTSKPQSLDGFNPSGSINDETKDWEDAELYDIIQDGMAMRNQPLTLNITTAGNYMASLGYEQQEEVKKILDEVVTDELYFGIIFTVDDKYKDLWDSPEDAWQYREAWVMANPNFPDVINETFFEQQVTKARNSAAKKIDILVKHLNVWHNSYTKWMNIDFWKKCASKKELDRSQFEGMPCHVFLDLASKKDICSMYALFYMGNDKKDKRTYATFGLNFLPEAVVQQRIVGRRSSYNEWADNGHFVLTPGNVTDYDVIEDHLKEWNNCFRIQKVGFDPWNATHLANNVAKMRLKTMFIPQQVKNLSEAMKTLEAWVMADRLTHYNDPVLSWGISNIVTKEDKNGNIFPVKEHAESKIDPGVSLINLAAIELEDPLPSQARKRLPKIHTL